MEKIAKNEDFLRKLVKSNKKQGIKLLRGASQDEYKSLVQLIVNSDSLLNRSEIKKCKSLGICKKFKSLGKITKKQLIKLFVKWFDRLIILVGCMIYRLFERGVAQVYIG